MPACLHSFMDEATSILGGSSIPTQPTNVRLVWNKIQAVLGQGPADLSSGSSEIIVFPACYTCVVTFRITPCPALPNFASNALILSVKICSTCQPCEFNLQALSLSFLSSVPGAERAQTKNSCSCYYLPPKYLIQISLENYRAAKMMIMDWALAADSTEEGSEPDSQSRYLHHKIPKKVLQLSNAKLKNRKSWNHSVVFGLFNWFLLVLLAKHQQPANLPSTVSSKTQNLFLDWAFPPYKWGTVVSQKYPERKFSDVTSLRNYQTEGATILQFGRGRSATDLTS